MTFHAAVWLDHNEAKIFHTTETAFDEKMVHAPKAHAKRHHGSSSESGHRAAEAQSYYHEVAEALSDASEILIVGPATAKLELVKHLHKHHAAMVPKVVGVETVDHPTDGQLVAYIRRYFEAVDKAH